MKRFLSPLLFLSLFGASAQAATLSLSDGIPNFIEGSSSTRPMAFMVKLSAPLKTDVTVKYATSDINATAPADYSASAGLVTFKAGQTSAVVNIPIRGDKVEEADERFRVRLSAPIGAVLGDSEGIGTVLDDDYAGKISIGPDISLAEGNSGFRTAKWTVSLSKKPLHPISVGYATKNGSARAPEDYTATTGTILFGAGNLTKSISIPVVGDAKVEKDETFSVKLSAPGYAFERDGSTAIIRNDDKAPAPTATPTATAAPTAAPTATPTATAIPTTPVSGKIAFSSSLGTGTPGLRISVINADGTNETQISPDILPDGKVNFDDKSPCFSPDGRKIVFASTRAKVGTNIYVMNADGTDVKQLTDSFSNESPSWSPDGTQVIFFGEVGASNVIRVSNLDGTVQSTILSGAGPGYEPRFSPDGRKIVFTNGNIYLMNADGSDAKSLNARGRKPMFSPDGSKISFWRERSTPGVVSSDDLFTMNVDGSGQAPIFESVARERMPAYSPDGTHIAYQTNRDSQDELYVMERDGRNQTRVKTLRPPSDPSWAPGFIAAPPPPAPLPSNGAGKITFASQRFGESQIFVINADGSGETRLTNNSAFDTEPKFSRDGSKIVFMSSRDSGATYSTEIYLMNADGTAQTRLTSNTAFDTTPIFSPDGSRIAYLSDQSGATEIYLMNLDGSGQTRVTNNGATQSSARIGDLAFSPDGNRIAFWMQPQSSGDKEIYTIRTDGKEQTRLTSALGDDLAPSFSPDGTKIVFISNRHTNLSNNPEIYVMNADGSGQARLTTNGFIDDNPCFSPDGRFICFDSDRTGTTEINIIHADGSTQTALTSVGRNYSSSWAIGSVAGAALTKARTAPAKPSGPSAPSS